jgi:hypothetical protein
LIADSSHARPNRSDAPALKIVDDPGPRSRANRIADMDDGHVDQIQKQGIACGFRSVAYFPQLLCDLD